MIILNIIFSVVFVGAFVFESSEQLTAGSVSTYTMALAFFKISIKLQFFLKMQN